jgi:hypothetical protein
MGRSAIDQLLNPLPWKFHHQFAGPMVARREELLLHPKTQKTHEGPSLASPEESSGAASFQKRSVTGGFRFLVMSKVYPQSLPKVYP